GEAWTRLARKPAGGLPAPPPLAGGGWEGGGRVDGPHPSPPPRAGEGAHIDHERQRGLQPSPASGEGVEAYQIRTRSSGAIHSGSPSSTPNASYQASMLRSGAK